MERKVKVKGSIVGKFAMLSLNICLIALLFSIFDLIFRFVKFILIYKELNYFWTLYSNYYFVIAILFSCSWLVTSYLITSYFFNNKKLIGFFNKFL